ncbi:hypothetical protein FKP32DRAFT_1647319 [Trametes sanguinea]|nr:hypothetical protein FKP32DRAFT_1647319 [Trametes sanguinea]
MRITIPLIGFSHVANAFSWARSSVPALKPSQVTGGFTGGAPPEEIATILQGAESLDRYSAKPDCFRRAAATIRANCAELESREDERVRAALSLTLCEIATAEHYSPPMECIPFQVGSESSHSPPEVHSGSKCVEALSRSAQYWSSYSGYLREVPQLCFAFQRWNDIDTAKELHHNTTRQSLTLLNYLADRERLVDDMLSRSSMLSEDMRAILDQLWSSASAVDTASGDLSGVLRLMANEMKHEFESAIAALKQSSKDHNDELKQVEVGMVNVMGQLATASSSVAPVFEKLLADSIESTYASVTLEMQHMHDLAAQGRLQLEGFRHGVEDLQHDVYALVGAVRQTNNVLEEGLEMSLMIREKQLDVVHASEAIASVLDRVSQKAHADMHSINGTAAAIIESLQKDISGDWRSLHWPWFRNVLIHCFEYISIADSGYLDLPAFRLMLTLVRVVWSLLGFASSGLMVCSLLTLRTHAYFCFRRAFSSSWLQEDTYFPKTGAQLPPKTVEIAQ